MEDYLKTKINIIGCVFAHDGLLEVVTNSVEGKEVVLNTSSNLTHDGFSATVIPGNGVITVQSDLPGLK